MIRSAEEREALKKAHLARLAAKGSPDYPALYASQPEQQRKAAANAAARKAERDAKDAIQRATVDAAAGAVDAFSGGLSTKGAES